ncbi:MAG TPA: hypothetical protein VJ437_05045 [Acidiferrobacterales bacterium]|nr:hypothetical protein [Acidiferrobacterales bacterium]
MIKSLMQHRVAKLLGFIAVIPLLIGHGVGGCFPWDNSGSCGDPETQNYVISGSVDPNSSINVGHNLKILVGPINYMSPASAAGGSVPPITYSMTYEADNGGTSAHYMYVTINDAPGGNAIGEMWVHSLGKSMKLIHPAANASYLSVSFAIDNQEFDLPQSSIIAGSSSYTLSGGSTGAEGITMITPLEISLNGTPIYTHAASPIFVQPPIVFPAAPGDVLRIRAGGAYPSAELSSIWLHTPSGNGIKLFQAMRSSDTQYTSVFFDARYVLE